MVNRINLSAMGCLLGVLVMALPARAQEPSPQAPESVEGVTVRDGAVVYSQAYFARYEPSNAEDMLRRIPGVPAILSAEDDEEEIRGFGSGGSQILLNGRRFPGKSNEITATLRRIAADSIERVELISGTSSEIRIQSQGLVVNLVLRPGASIGGAGNFELNARSSEYGQVDLDGLVAYSGSKGSLSYGFGLERNLWSPPAFGEVRWSYRTRDEVFYYPSGRVLEARPQRARRTHDKWILTGSLAYDFADGGRATLNGLYEVREVSGRTLTPLTRFLPDGSPAFTALELRTRESPDVETVEIGGEYVSRIGPGDFTGLFIVRREDEPVLNRAVLDLGARVVQLSRNETRLETGEDIVRAAYAFPLATGRSLELGMEGARNTLAQELVTFHDLDGDGLLERAPAPGGASRPEVEELRGEAFAVFKWQATEKLSIDASLNYEYSKLTTNYPAYPARELGFLKPRLDVRYKATPRDQLRLLMERTVSQLDFENFVPNYNVDDRTVESGNPALEPEKVWTLELGYERRLPGDGGLIDLRAFYDDITDAIDRLPFCRIAGRLEPVERCLAPGAAGRLDSAFGNVGSASRYGIEAKASLRLGFVGLPDAVLSLRGLRRWSDISDPFVRDARRLRDDREYEYDVSFRHDLTDWRMSYGFTYKALGVAAINSDLPFTEYFEIDPLLEAFVERRLSGALTARLELQNLLHSHERRSRYLYDVAAADGRIHRAVRRIDFYEERRDIRGAVRLLGRF